MERVHSKLPAANHYLYKNNSIENNDARSFKLKGKLEKDDFLSKCGTSNVPGPGMYKTIGIDAVGKYHISKFP